MTTKFRFSLITVTVLMILILSAVWTVPAFADDAAPPPPVDTPTEVTPPVAADPIDVPVVASTADALADTATVDTTIPAEEVPSPDANSTDILVPTAQDSTLGDVLVQAPEGTDVVVLNATGETLPLASQEAADVIANGDPMWCPVGVTPGGAGCSPNFPKFGTSTGDINTELLRWLQDNDPGKAGVIWIHQDYDSGAVENANTSFTLDGSTGKLDNMAKYALTIQGGWTGTGTAINQLNPSEFNASLSIIDWNAPITINDIIVTGATVNPNPGTNGALQVETKRNITLNRVQSSDNVNGLWGAVLDNGNGSPGTLAPITVNDSIFNHNSGSGLVAYSEGAITVRNLTANYNGTNGVTAEWGTLLTNWVGQNTNKPITLNGTNEFKGNLSEGLYVTSFGIITLNNITAYANADTTNNEGTGAYANSFLAVKLTGTNLFNYNQVHGLEISSHGTVSLNNVTASNNGQNGLGVDSGGSISLNNVTANNNGQNGIGVDSGGSISLNNIIANINGQNGALLDNCLSPGLNTACITTAKTVTLAGSNAFKGNARYGLYVEASGAIKLSQVTASQNGYSGVSLDNCASSDAVSTVCTTPLPYAVTITNPSTFLANGIHGLYILATGPVSLKSVTSSSNGNRGVYIDNRANLLKPQNVTISGTNLVNGNDNYGLWVRSYGAVTISNITANDNGRTDSNGWGVYVDNLAYSTPMLGSLLLTRLPVTLSGYNTFNNNYSGGLAVFSLGAITVSNITAVGNGVTGGTGDGAYLDNHTDWYGSGITVKPFSANVTLSGFGYFEDNGDEGLQINSRGAIKLNSVTANENYDVGLYVDNRIGTNITVRQPVTLTGTNSFNNNTGGGVVVFSLGAVTLSNITANGNLLTGATGDGDGVFIQNNSSWSPNGVLTAYVANVTISGYGYFEGNADDGLDIQTKGTVTLATITANSNGDNGANIVAVGTILPQNVTLNGVNSFYGNGFTSAAGDGLYIQGDGKITINNLSAIGNRDNGATLDNFTFKKLNKFLGVTLTGFNTFQRNQGANGLFIHTDGSVIMSHVNADDNTGNGMQVTATKNITLTCGNAFSNTGLGFLLNSGAVLTLKGVHAYYNAPPQETLTYITLIRTVPCP